MKAVEVEEDPLPPTPEVSHSVEGDIGNYTPTPMDVKLVEPIYGEYLRNNDGTHLDSKIVDDKLLQERYSSIIIYPLSQYDLSTRHIGKSFVRLLAKEIDGVRERKWNIEKLMCFVSMILQRSLDFKGVSNIKRRIKQRILE